MQRAKFILPCLPFLPAFACTTPDDGAASLTPTKESTAPEPKRTGPGRMTAVVCTAVMIAMGACGSDADTMPDETTDADTIETADGGIAPAGGEGGGTEAQGGSAGAPQDTGTGGAAGSGGEPVIGEGGSGGTEDGGQGGTPVTEYLEPPARDELSWKHVFTSGKYLLTEHLTYRDGTYTRTRTYTVIRNSTNEIEGLYGCVAHLISENSVLPEEKGPFLILRHATKEDFATYNITPRYPLRDQDFGESYPQSYLNQLYAAWRENGGRGGCSFPKSLEES